MLTKHLSKETGEKIREEIQSGKSKYRTAADFGLHSHTVYRKTQDLTGCKLGWYGIRGNTLKLLQEIMQLGYVLSSKQSTSTKYRILKKYFPNICRINMQRKTILYLDDKASVAAKAFLSDMNKKIMSFQELKQITKVFGIELSSEEKHKIVGKSRKHKHPVIRRKDGGYLSSYSEFQMKTDDFNENYVFPHKSTTVKSQKIQSSNEDSLLTNDDSLIDFYIRKYWDKVVPKVALIS